MEHRSVRPPYLKWGAFIFVLVLSIAVYGYKSRVQPPAANNGPAMTVHAKADSMSVSPVASCCKAPLSRGQMLSGKISQEGVSK